MNIPTLAGTIDRRILINFRVDGEVLAKFLPQPFRPRLVEGKGLAGICLIRLKHIRPLGLPAFIGLGSENAAHRIAVEWTENGQVKQGVYIPRRDTNSLLNHWAGGRVFPGVHYLAKFDVHEDVGSYKIHVKSSDNNIISISAIRTGDFNTDSVFKDLGTASEFFKKGAIGFSPNKSVFDGMELKTIEWRVEPLAVKSVTSTFFENKEIFPDGSVTFDNALLMRNIVHQWKNYNTLVAAEAGVK